MNKEELDKILEEHEEWLKGEGGKRASLCGVDLSDADFSNTDLSYVDFGNADLSSADFSHANLYSANLSHADLSYAILYYANLCYADLNHADLDCADLSHADLDCANLSSADLSRADLSYANLNCADFGDANLLGADFENSILNKTELDEKEKIRKGIILKEPMTGWKKCLDNVIVELKIPKGATVFSINNGKCRTNTAKCVKVYGDDVGVSGYDNSMKYKAGKTYEIEDFNLQYNVECAEGIHFFKTREEAEDYEL